MKKTCDFCHCEDSPQNPVGYYKVNVGTWGSICQKCKTMHESANGVKLTEGSFLSEVLPDRKPENMSIL